MTTRLIIRPATSPADLDDVRTLFREYERGLGLDLCFQGFAEELDTLPGRYAPPRGRLYLADADGALAGCIALREFAPGIAEMKRLFVRESARGAGAGRALVGRIIADAREAGYGAMRLDTLRVPQMAAANRMYDALGFRDIAPYYANPLPDVRYMELALGTEGAPPDRAQG